MNATDVRTSNRLIDFSERIREANERAKSASVEAAGQYLEAGRLLIEAKAECKHGEWGPFLEMAGIHERQARRLMRLARSGLKADTVSEMGGLKAALHHLSTPMQPEGDDDIWEWAAERVEGPIGEADMEMDANWFGAKVMRLAGVPYLAAFCISMMKNYGDDMMRLAPHDDLMKAGDSMATIIKDEAVIPFEAGIGVNTMMELTVAVKLTSERILGQIWHEAEYRSRLDEATYSREFDAIHARFMAKAEKQLADVHACERKADKMATVDGKKIAAAWLMKQYDRIRAEAAS